MDWYSQMLETFSEYWTNELGRRVSVTGTSEFGYGSGMSGFGIETIFYFDDRTFQGYEGSLSEFIEELNE